MNKSITNPLSSEPIRNSRRTYRLGTLIFAVLLNLLIQLLPFAEDFEHAVLDQFFRVRGPVMPPAEIAIVAIDEESYRNLNVSQTSAWPRALHVRLLDRLMEMGASKAVFDILFLSPTDPEIDLQLRDRMSKITTVIGAELAQGSVDRATGYQEVVLSRPYGLFREVATMGLVNLPSVDGAVRTPMASSEKLGSGLLSGVATPVPPFAAVVSGREYLPSTKSSKVYINYYGPPRTIHTFSVYQVLDTTHPLPQELLQGKTVFIGLSRRTGYGIQDKDSFITPFISEGFTAGVEIHATITGNLIHDTLIRRTPQWVERCVALGIGVIAALFFSVLSPLFGLVMLVTLVSAVVIGSYLLFVAGIFLPLASVGIISQPLTYGVALLGYYFSVLREQRRLKRAFQMYLSPEMADEVARSSEALELGGSLVEATALFTDISGFTRISEGLTPAETGSMLNQYFTEVMQAIFRKRGTLIKFIGDAVFALWGAPIKVSNHAQLAFESAQSILIEVATFNASGRYPPLKTRIGLNSGTMLVGNLGAAERFDFTAIGDAVNLASRVEGMNKYLGSSLLMTGAVFEQLTQRAGLVEFGSFKVSGKDTAVKLYGMFEHSCDPEEEKAFQNGVRAYWARDFEEALHFFARATSRTHQFEPATTLYVNAIELAKLDSEGDWDGTIKVDTK